MKANQLLLAAATIALLGGCGQTPLVVPQNNADKLAGADLTQTPSQLVVYPNDRPSIPDGAPVFEQNCSSCHSAAEAKTQFNMQWAHRTKTIDIYRTIAFGGTDADPSKHQHPAFTNKLSVRELWDCAVYARAIGQPALTDKEIDAITPVFGSNCAVCHGTKGDGDPGNLGISHNLEPQPANFLVYARFFNRTDDVLYDHIANGIRWEGMPNFLGKKDSIKNVVFDDAYIRKLVQYVHKFHINNSAVLTANAGAGGSGAASGGAASSGGASSASSSAPKSAQ